MDAVETRGARIPVLGLGTWKLAGDRCTEVVQEALRLGYRHLDTAQAYDNEEEVGRGLRLAGTPREEVFLVTKLPPSRLDPRSVRHGTEESLGRLGTDYLDLLLIHWPSDEVPLGETLGAMQELCEKGRVRYAGVSNFPPALLEQACRHAPVVCDQVEYHPLLSQDELLATVRRLDCALVAYSPLAQGRVLDEEVLHEIGEEHGKSAAQVALRWLLQQEAVVAIPKASSPEHLEANLRVFDFELSPEEVERVDALAQREERLVDPPAAPTWER